MKALVFGEWDPNNVPADPASPRLVQNLANTPMVLREMEHPALKGDDWAVLKTRLTGICGSDTKQVLLDFEGPADSPMTAFISFPQVLGHEVVATVEQAGPDSGVAVGQRVVLNPWLSCEVRGIDPICPACEDGDLSLCWSFLDGSLAPGIHTGNSSDATGGFAEYLPAHRRMMFPIPDEISDEVAVLADPFSVALHAVTRNPPPPGGTVVVYGAGALGTCATAILAALHPDVKVATVAMWDGQRNLAEKLGATTFVPEPREELIAALVEWSGGVLRTPWEGSLPIAWPGGIDVVYDTVGAPATLEVGLRVIKTRGTIVELGLSTMDRCEWTPWYFKEARLIGSSAFGIEEVEGVRKHAIEHYLDLVASGRINLDGMLTHTFELDAWRSAFSTLIEQGSTGAIKCAFDFR